MTCQCSAKCQLEELPDESRPRVSSNAKCNFIPVQIKRFCCELYKAVRRRFALQADCVIAEFIFDRWILKALCQDANKNGLITETFLNERNLATNLQLLKDAFSSMLSSQQEFDISVHLLPKPISAVCISKRF